MKVQQAKAVNLTQFLIFATVINITNASPDTKGNGVTSGDDNNQGPDFNVNDPNFKAHLLNAELNLNEKGNFKATSKHNAYDELGNKIGEWTHVTKQNDGRLGSTKSKFKPMSERESGGLYPFAAMMQLPFMGIGFGAHRLVMTAATPFMAWHHTLQPVYAQQQQQQPGKTIQFPTFNGGRVDEQSPMTTLNTAVSHHHRTTINLNGDATSITRSTSHLDANGGLVKTTHHTIFVGNNGENPVNQKTTIIRLHD